MKIQLFACIQMTEKLKKSERERIIFQHLKGIDDPLYEVSQTKYGKWIVKARSIEIEEEEVKEPEPEEEEPEEQLTKLQPVKLASDKQQAKRERRKRNRHAKQNAKRILDALTNLINSNNNGEDDDDSSDDDKPHAPQLIEQPNINPGPLIIRRRRLAF